MRIAAPVERAISLWTQSIGERKRKAAIDALRSTFMPLGAPREKLLTHEFVSSELSKRPTGQRRSLAQRVLVDQLHPALCEATESGTSTRSPWRFGMDSRSVRILEIFGRFRGLVFPKKEHLNLCLPLRVLRLPGSAEYWDLSVKMNDYQRPLVTKSYLHVFNTVLGKKIANSGFCVQKRHNDTA